MQCPQIIIDTSGLQCQGEATYAPGNVYKTGKFLSLLRKENTIKLSVSADIVEASTFRTHALLFVALLQLHVEQQHEHDTVLDMK